MTAFQQSSRAASTFTPAELTSSDVEAIQVLGYLSKGANLRIPSESEGNVATLARTGQTNIQVSRETAEALRDLGFLYMNTDAGFEGGFSYRLIQFKLESYGVQFLERLLALDQFKPPTPNSEPLKLNSEEAALLRTALFGFSAKGSGIGVLNALRLGADPNTVCTEADAKGMSIDERHAGFTPLLFAAAAGPDGIDAVRALLQAGADPHYKKSDGYNVMFAATGGSASYENYAKDAGPLINVLVQSGVPVEPVAKNGTTPAFFCVNQYEGTISYSAINALLMHGANPNANLGSEHRRASTLVHNALLTHVIETAACRHHQWPNAGELGILAVKALVEAGANLNSDMPVPNHYESPLGCAAVQGNKELVEYLLEKGANPAAVDAQGLTLGDYLRASLRQMRASLSDRKGGNSNSATNALASIVNVIDKAAAA